MATSCAKGCTGTPLNEEGTRERGQQPVQHVRFETKRELVQRGEVQYRRQTKTAQQRRHERDDVDEAAIRHGQPLSQHH